MSLCVELSPNTTSEMSTTVELSKHPWTVGKRTPDIQDHTTRQQEYIQVFRWPISLHTKSPNSQTEKFLIVVVYYIFSLV